MISDGERRRTRKKKKSCCHKKKELAGLGTTTDASLWRLAASLRYPWRLDLSENSFPWFLTQCFLNS